MEINKSNWKYGFWFWSYKLEAIIAMIAELISYELSDDEIALIKEALTSTNDEREIWYSHPLNGLKTELRIELAYDGEEGEEMIHIRIHTTEDMRIKLETLDLFQSLFGKLELEK